MTDPGWAFMWAVCPAFSAHSKHPHHLGRQSRGSLRDHLVWPPYIEDDGTEPREGSDFPSPAEQPESRVPYIPWGWV